MSQTDRRTNEQTDGLPDKRTDRHKDRQPGRSVRFACVSFAMFLSFIILVVCMHVHARRSRIDRLLVL